MVSDAPADEGSKQRKRPPRRRLALSNAAAGFLAVKMLKLARHLRRPPLADFFGFCMRNLGLFVPEHHIGRANLAAAFPEKSPAEIDSILAGVWDNLARVAAELAHLDRIRFLDDRGPAAADVIYDQVTLGRVADIRRDGRANLAFTAHLANWEIAALAAPFFKLDSAVLYRRPNLRAVDEAVIKMRAGCMGTLIPAGPFAPVRLASALERGTHVGLLVDQYYVRGVDVTFFGRTCKANPLIAQLARHFESPIRGLRVVRLPDRHRFTVEITEPIPPARGADGRIDLQGTMQAITSVVEGWVREHPEQWLWLHRRWR